MSLQELQVRRIVQEWEEIRYYNKSCGPYSSGNFRFMAIDGKGPGEYYGNYPSIGYKGWLTELPEHVAIAEGGDCLERLKIVLKNMEKLK
jgi:hypothetical protein